MLFVSRNRRVLICTATAWVVNIALTNFDHTTVPVNPLKSCTSTCSGLFSISLSLIPLSLYKKMSKGRGRRTLVDFRFAIAKQLFAGVLSQAENRKCTMKAAALQVTTTPENATGHFIIQREVNARKRHCI